MAAGTVSTEKLGELYGVSGARMRQLRAQGAPIEDPDALYEWMRENTSKRSVLYPGVPAALDCLKSAGYKLGCVTNKAARFTEPLLRDLGVRDAFSIVVSGDTLPRKKPHPQPLLHAAEFFAVAPEDSLMVGDSVSDVKAARAAGFQIVCMSYGYNHGMDIRDAGPDAVIDSMMELRGLLEAAPVPERTAHDDDT